MRRAIAAILYLACCIPFTASLILLIPAIQALKGQLTDTSVRENVLTGFAFLALIAGAGLLSYSLFHLARKIEPSDNSRDRPA